MFFEIVGKFCFGLLLSAISTVLLTSIDFQKYNIYVFLILSVIFVLLCFFIDYCLQEDKNND